ncbi:unnamed protein product, partial [Rotaria socialis]
GYIPGSFILTSLVLLREPSGATVILFLCLSGSTIPQLLKNVTGTWTDLSTEDSTEVTRCTLRDSAMGFCNFQRNPCIEILRHNQKIQTYCNIKYISEL